MNIEVKLKPAEEGGYTVYTPSLHGGISEVDTFEEADENIREAVEFYFGKDD